MFNVFHQVVDEHYQHNQPKQNWIPKERINNMIYFSQTSLFILCIRVVQFDSVYISTSWSANIFYFHTKRDSLKYDKGCFHKCRENKNQSIIILILNRCYNWWVLFISNKDLSHSLYSGCDCLPKSVEIIIRRIESAT